jgi:hypothetical protein
MSVLAWVADFPQKLQFALFLSVGLLAILIILLEF